jgi:transposase
MATIQQKTTNGHKYWYIVESIRVNGKPRPIVLEYLGKADALLKRLQGVSNAIKFKSYSHGLVSKLLDMSATLNICTILNKYIDSKRTYTAQKPIRNNLTAGASLLLAGIGRSCTITSKDSWAEWARQTSMEYLLRTNFSKIDSQHFWDTMDAFPAESIENAELDILRNVFANFDISKESLFYDTTNFYTYINTTNSRCSIAKRGKNKQKRTDLRQVGLALVVSKDSMIPLFHHSYEGNMNDSKVFKSLVSKIKKRFDALGLNTGDHTIVFDRGNNSKKNIEMVESLKMNYVGALTPYHHRELVDEATKRFEQTTLNDKIIQTYKTDKIIWGYKMTVVVLISAKLKEGQIRGIYTSIANCDKAIKNINESIVKPKAKKRTEKKLQELLEKLLSRYKMQNIIEFEILKDDAGCFGIKHNINYDKLAILEENMGFRIIMTNRHEWGTNEIIQAYHGQSFVENTFKNMKNKQHLSFNPQYHWTDQKIQVHNFCCVIGYMLSALIYKSAKDKGFKGSMDLLLDKLSNIRLGTLLENTGKQGKPKAIYKLEEMNDVEISLANNLEILNIHEKPLKIKGFSVYI